MNYRVTATMNGKRMAFPRMWMVKRVAQKYADETNTYLQGANARVVKDSEKIRKMIP
jgi:hypothetical protein